MLYPLFISVLVLYILDHPLNIPSWCQRIIIFVLIISAFPADWSCIAVLAILSMYPRRGNLKGQMKAILLWSGLYALVSYLFVNKVYAIETIGVLMVYPVLYFYNGQRGKAKWMKWFFYIYYPLHLVVLGILRIMIYGDLLLSV